MNVEWCTICAVFERSLALENNRDVKYIAISTYFSGDGVVFHNANSMRCSACKTHRMSVGEVCPCRKGHINILRREAISKQKI